MSDPSVLNMNDTQWLFEFEGLYHQDEKRLEEYKALSEIVRKSIISLLGLDLFPVEDIVGVDNEGKNIVRYRMPEDNEILPLAIFTGREELLSEIVERHSQMKIQEEADLADDLYESGEAMTIEELEEFMDDGSDIDFVDPESFKKNLAWKNPTTQAYLASMVEDISKKDENLDDELELDITEAASVIHNVKKSSKVFIE